MHNISVNYYKLIRKSLTNSWKLFRGLLLFGLCFIILYPLIYMLSMAFRAPKDIFDPSVIWVPKNFTMHNIQSAMELMNYSKAVTLSFTLNIFSSILQLISCAATGYSFARFDYKFKKLMFALVLFSIIIPPQIIVAPLFEQFQNFTFFGLGSIAKIFTGESLKVNLIDSPLTFYIPAIFGAGLKSGLFIFIYRQFFKGLPKELEDAAAIDGCGFFSCYFRVMIPNSLVVFVTVFLLSAVWYWNDYFTASMFMRNVNTVSTALAKLSLDAVKYTGEVSVDPYKIVTLMQAGCLLSILPMLIIYAILQRNFIQGVERTGIVG